MLLFFFFFFFFFGEKITALHHKTCSWNEAGRDRLISKSVSIMRRGLMVESICLRAPGASAVLQDAATSSHGVPAPVSRHRSLKWSLSVSPQRGVTVMRRHIIAMGWLQVTRPVDAANRWMWKTQLFLERQQIAEARLQIAAFKKKLPLKIISWQIFLGIQKWCRGMRSARSHLHFCKCVIILSTRGFGVFWSSILCHPSLSGSSSRLHRTISVHVDKCLALVTVIKSMIWAQSRSPGPDADLSNRHTSCFAPSPWIISAVCSLWWARSKCRLGSVHPSPPVMNARVTRVWLFSHDVSITAQ